MRSRPLSWLLLALAALIPPGVIPPWMGLLLSTAAAVHFWWTHAFALRAINWRFLIFFLSLSLASWLLLNGTGVTGLGNPAEMDLRRISSLKRSSRVALRLYFPEKPTSEERWLRLGLEPPPSPVGEEQTRQWARRNLDGLPLAEKTARLQRWFQTEFRYSLETDWKDVDDFVFRTRQGFCVHFSHAARALLEASGHPVQLVYGYAGGSWNPLTRVLTYRDEDAHSWLEIQERPGAPWVRVDPTGWVAAVAPETSTAGEFGGISANGARAIAGLAGFLLGAALLLGDPRRTLRRILPPPYSETLVQRLDRLGEGSPALRARCEELARIYDRVYFSRNPRRADSIRLRWRLAQLRLLLGAGIPKWFSRFVRGQPGPEHQARTS